MSGVLSLACHMRCRKIVTLLTQKLHQPTGIQLGLGCSLRIVRFFLSFLRKLSVYDLKTLDPGRWGGSVPDCRHVFFCGLLGTLAGAWRQPCPLRPAKTGGPGAPEPHNLHLAGNDGHRAQRPWPGNRQRCSCHRRLAGLPEVRDGRAGQTELARGIRTGRYQRTDLCERLSAWPTRISRDQPQCAMAGRILGLRHKTRPGSQPGRRRYISSGWFLSGRNRR